MVAVFTMVTGMLYPAIVTGLAHIFFRHQAEGSLVESRGAVIGSHLLAQNFTRTEYFWPRPSAAGSNGYDASSSGASNLGPTNRALESRVRAAVEKVYKDNPNFRGPVPVDMVTESASGLDPDISPAAATAQAARVAAARGVAVTEILSLIGKHVQPRMLGLFGEPRVNVLQLNLDLDRAMPLKQARN
jgi:potassium-transporting ATPase KdpC subunit